MMEKQLGAAFEVKEEFSNVSPSDASTKTLACMKKILLLHESLLLIR